MGWFSRKESEASAKNRSEGTVPLVRVDDAFTRLVLESATDTTGNGMNRLWKAVFDLEHWHFIQQFPPDGAAPEGPPPFGWPRPMASRVEGKLFILAFTSSDRVVACANHNELVHPKYGIPLLEIPRDGAAEMLCRLDERQIDGVLFNQNKGEQGFFAPLTNIPTMYEWCLDRLPDGLFDPFVKSVTTSDARAGWQRLHRRLALMDQWLFIGDVTRPKSPQLYVHEGEPMLLVFTDDKHVSKGAALAGGADEQGRMPLIPTTPLDAADFAGRVAAHGDGQVSSVLFNLGTSPFILPIQGLKAMIEQYRKKSLN